MDHLPKDGDEVWYTIRARAEIVRTDVSETYAVIKILTGELKGRTIVVPLESLSPTK